MTPTDRERMAAVVDALPHLSRDEQIDAILAGILTVRRVWTLRCWLCLGLGAVLGAVAGFLA